MTTIERPAVRPANPCFSSGPTAKRTGWSPENLKEAVLGRSHRSAPGKARLKRAIDETREMLSVPDEYLIGIVPASDTGAFEMAMWSMLGARGVDCLAWESFGKGWVTDILKQLRLDDVRVLDADYGRLPDLSSVDCDRDIVFTWNGTTSGVRVPDGAWIAADRKGLTFCDATSAAFAQSLPFDKLDVVTYSWQKVLGGEAQHGVIILSPRAIERLETYVPAWPLPKIFRLTKGGKLIDGVFRGETINTPSMLCLEDYLDALSWARSVGGLGGLIDRADNNASVISDWVERTPWVDFLAEDPRTRSNTSVCLTIIDPDVAGRSQDEQAGFAKALTKMLDDEGVAYDIGAYRDAPAGLRIWCGATVEASDLALLTEWLDWAFAATLADWQKAA